jgi:hypothetical protein
MDGDGVTNDADNCSDLENMSQQDQDEDGLGDACDDDADGDGVDDTEDNCVGLSNPGQDDTDGDGEGDTCDDDDDDDGILDIDDNCRVVVNPGQEDLDFDGEGDLCDDDVDGDGVENSMDNCPEEPNEDQLDGDYDGIGDLCDPSTTTWLLSINNVTHQLLWVNTATGQGTAVCDLDTSDNYPSSTFTRAGDLLALNNTQDRLDHIDPCTCEITPIGPVGFQSTIVGITTDQGVNLYGVETYNNNLVSMLSSTGEATVVGTLGMDFGASGATWSDELGAMWAINSLDDNLYVIDPETGLATFQASLDRAFGNVGIEFHAGKDKLYACTGSKLYSVDTETGWVFTIGTIDNYNCNNLAAPYSLVECPGWPQP